MPIPARALRSLTLRFASTDSQVPPTSLSALRDIIKDPPMTLFHPIPASMLILLFAVVPPSSLHRHNMKKIISILFVLFSASAAFAGGTISLTTYYPPPTAAYNTVKLATNSANSNAPSETPNLYCTGANNGAIFINSNTGVLNECNGVSSSVTYCSVTANNGTLYSDNNGNLHVCMNGQSSVFPQQCYNSFCSCAALPCSLCTASCANGFASIPVDAAGDSYDTFQTASNNYVYSYACCSQ